jgi:hypothetical protein
VKGLRGKVATEVWEHGLHLHMGGQMCTKRAKLLHLIRRCKISDRRRCKISDRRLVEPSCDEKGVRWGEVG